TEHTQSPAGTDLTSSAEWHPAPGSFVAARKCYTELRTTCRGNEIVQAPADARSDNDLRGHDRSRAGAGRTRGTEVLSRRIHTLPRGLAAVGCGQVRPAWRVRPIPLLSRLVEGLLRLRRGPLPPRRFPDNATDNRQRSRRRRWRRPAGRITSEVRMRSSSWKGSSGIAMAVLALGACADNPTQPANPGEDFNPAASVLTAQEGRYLVVMAPGSGVPRNVTGVLANTGARVVHDLRQINLLVVEGLASDAASALAARSDIRAVTPDFTAQWIPPAAQLMGQRMQLPAGARGGVAQGTDQTGAFFYAEQWN